jgi:hypothetical protein
MEEEYEIPVVYKTQQLHFKAFVLSPQKELLYHLHSV